MKVFSIHSDFITITQLLKAFGLISSGGQAKYFLLKNTVLLNNVQITERGKKIYPKDKVQIGVDLYLIKHD